MCVCVYSASTSNVAKLEEMERLLREAQAEKNRLLEYKVNMRNHKSYKMMSFHS